MKMSKLELASIGIGHFVYIKPCSDGVEIFGADGERLAICPNETEAKSKIAMGDLKLVTLH